MADFNINVGSGSSSSTSSGTSASQQGTQMIPGMEGVYSQLLGMNSSNYGNVLNAYGSGQNTAASQLPGIYGGYGQLQGNVADTLGMGQVLGQNGNWGVAAPAAQAIQRQAAQQGGQTQQSMINAGLGNTTAAAQAQNQNTYNANLAYGNLGANLASQAAGYQAQIGQAGLGAQMQGLGMQTGLYGEQGKSLAGYNFANTAGALTGGYGSSTSQQQSNSKSQQQSSGGGGSGPQLPPSNPNPDPSGPYNPSQYPTQPGSPYNPVGSPPAASGGPGGPGSPGSPGQPAAQSPEMPGGDPSNPHSLAQNGPPGQSPYGPDPGQSQNPSSQGQKDAQGNDLQPVIDQYGPIDPKTGVPASWKGQDQILVKEGDPGAIAVKDAYSPHGMKYVKLRDPKSATNQGGSPQPYTQAATGAPYPR